MNQTQTLIVAAALLGCIALPARAARAQWTVTYMHPAGATHSQIRSLGSGQAAGNIEINGVTKAVLWDGFTNNVIILDPGGGGAGSGSQVAGAGGGQQVGAAAGLAALWLGSPQSWMSLAPPDTQASSAVSTDGAHQVGWVTLSDTSSTRHATLWNGTAASWIDLNPPGSLFSSAGSVLGDEQGGVSFVDSRYRASLWRGSAASWVDLNPPGAQYSNVLGMHAGQQVGLVSGANLYQHAALWRGSASSFIDLHPPTLPFSGSSANAVFDGMQAGAVGVDSHNHASVWSSTAGSWQDLHEFLSPGRYQESVAMGIWHDASTIYVGGYGVLEDTGSGLAQSIAIVWRRPMCCAADFNCSDTVNTQDVFDYINAWFAGEPRTDLDGNGISVFDIFAFLGAWFAGCP